MLFKDKDLELKFGEDGFVTLPMLNAETVLRLLEIYEQEYGLQVNGLQPSLRVGNATQNIAVHHKIGNIVSESLEKWFSPFAFNANHFIAKAANNPNEFSLHQDWNVVDETKYIAAHIWIPLQDTDEHNGGLFVVKGSHKFYNNYRSGSCGIAFIERTEKVKEHVTTLNMKAGEAIIYQQALFHGSYPNASLQTRLTCLTSIRPDGIPMIYCHEENGELVSYEITPQILFEQIGNLEKGKPPIMAGSEIFLREGVSETGYISNENFENKLSRNQLT